jgi:hypothetical protein
MAQNHLKAGHAIEMPRQDETNKLDARIIMPAKSTGGEGGI